MSYIWCPIPRDYYPYRKHRLALLTGVCWLRWRDYTTLPCLPATARTANTYLFIHHSIDSNVGEKFRWLCNRSSVCLSEATCCSWGEPGTFKYSTLWTAIWHCGKVHVVLGVLVTCLDHCKCLMKCYKAIEIWCLGLVNYTDNTSRILFSFFF